MKKQDDTNIPSQYGLNEGNGAILKEKIVQYRELLNQISDGAKTAELNYTFNVDDRYDDEQKEDVSWENSLFHEMPVCATITMLTKLQNDIRTEENNIVSWLENQTDAGDLRVNKMNAYVIPKSDYVIEGGKYSARIIMAAIDSTQTPEYMVNGQQIGADGVYEVIARGVGAHKFSGQIVYTNPSGEKEYLPFESSYSVGEPSVTISNTEMNIMYRGFDNKFDISVPGISNDKLKVDVQGAALSRKGSLWIIKPGDNVKQVTINVRAELDGKVQSMGARTYRVKTLPKPSAFFVSGGSSLDQGALAKKQIIAPDAMIEASYGEDGILDLDFKIRTFTLRAGGKLLESKSSKLTEEQKNLIKTLRSGEDVIFNSIHAIGPDGKDRLLNTIALTIK
jgi:gliding motility-associated protein GldM